MASNKPIALSNEVDDFVQAGLYPGGAGIIKDIAYVLWDYDGKRAPESQCAVRMTMEPRDGSNEGKDVEVYWSVGPSSEYQPDNDGVFLLSTTTTAPRTNSNWWFVLTKFRDTCGMEKGHLSTPGKGIGALIGSEVTLSRVDQPHREGLEPAEAEGGQQRRKPTILIPTYCKFPWDKGAKRTATTRTAPAASAPAAPAAAAPASSSNGSGDLGSYILELLSEHGDTLETIHLSKLLLDSGKIVNVKGLDRANMIKALKDPAQLDSLGAQYGFTHDAEGGLLIKN